MTKTKTMKRLAYALAIITILLSCNTNYNDPEFDAILNVKQHVTQQLKAPSTAEFNQTTATKLKDNVYLVKGTVDAQNGFGAMIRKDFSCEIEFVSRNKHRISNFTLN